MVKQTCCCGCIGIHTGVLIIGILTLIGTALSTIGDIFRLSKSDEIVEGDTFSYTVYSLKERVYYSSIIDIIVNIVWAVCALLLIYGNRTKKTIFYIPFIIVSIFDLILEVVKIILFIVASIAVLSGEIKGLPESEKTPIFIDIIILVFVSICIFLIDAYFVHVVVSGRRYLLNMLASIHVSYSRNVPNEVNFENGLNK